MASCLESARLSSSPSWLFCQSCSTVPNLITIPDLCHQHLLGAPCMTLLLWVGPLGAMLSLVRHPGGGRPQKSRANQSYYSN